MDHVEDDFVVTVQWSKFIVVLPQTLLCMCSVLSWLLQVLTEECWQRWFVVPCQLRALAYVHENKLCAAWRIAIAVLMTMTKGVEWGEAVCLNSDNGGVCLCHFHALVWWYVSVGNECEWIQWFPGFGACPVWLKVVPACGFGFFCPCWRWKSVGNNSWF